MTTKYQLLTSVHYLSLPWLCHHVDTSLMLEETFTFGNLDSTLITPRSVRSLGQGNLAYMLDN